jgi:DNA-binding NarL/FixJ family response regulator
MPSVMGKINAKKWKILIVDDHPIVRKGLVELIEDETDLIVIGEADDAGDALRMLDNDAPDLCLIDISLKGMNGLELIKQIKARNEDIKMLVSSMHDETLYAERALRAGAMGYINKNEATETLVSAIRQTLDGRVYLSNKMSERLLERVFLGQKKKETWSIDSLTDRELEVFELIGQGLTTRQIAARLHLSPKTVETYRDNIKSKLNLSTSSELVRHAVKWALDHE